MILVDVVVVVFVLNFLTELIFKALFISSMNKEKNRTHTPKQIHKLHTYQENESECVAEGERHSRTKCSVQSEIEKKTSIETFNVS